MAEQKEDMFNRIREVFNIGRMIKVDGTCGGYMHHSGTTAGVLLEIEGGTDDAAKDVAMHVAAMKPASLDEASLDPALIENERDILTKAALAEGKPANIVDKMVEGRLKNFYAERCLTAQPFVKDDKQSVGEYAQSHGMKLKNFWHWIIGEKADG